MEDRFPPSMWKGFAYMIPWSLIYVKPNVLRINNIFIGDPRRMGKLIPIT